MFDLVCFFFIYLPVTNLIRDAKASRLFKLACSLSLLVLMAAYLVNQIVPTHRAENLYQLLDLHTTTPSERELKKAFRDASKKYHPDKNQGATTDKFLEVKVALDIISSPFTKSAYDLFGQTKFD
jgi:preprotein translocase subunit Sec63